MTKLTATVTKLPQASTGTPAFFRASRVVGVPVLAWGQFVTVAVNFLILAFVIFLLVRAINRLRRHHEAQKAAEAAPPAEDIVLLREIRDSLKRS